jgi:hypothetical protein
MAYSYLFLAAEESVRLSGVIEGKGASGSYFAGIGEWAAQESMGFLGGTAFNGVHRRRRCSQFLCVHRVLVRVSR